MTVETRSAAINVTAFSRVVAFGRLVRFSHTIFAMPFALMAVFLAERGIPHWGKLLLVVVCMVAARSAAMAFNRIADASIDARNPRTAGRPIPAGQISLRQAGLFYFLCALVLLAGCGGFWWGFGNPWPLALALPVLAFLSAYSFSKRFSSLCHLWLGLALGLSPAAAWLAIAPSTFGLPAVLLGMAVTCWVGGFDIIYALQDLEVDRREGLLSLPARLGPAGALWVSRGLHAVTIGLLLWLGSIEQLGWLYHFGVAMSIALLAAEQCMVSPTDWRRAGSAFTYANAAMSVVLAVCTILDVLL